MAKDAHRGLAPKFKIDLMVRQVAQVKGTQRSPTRLARGENSQWYTKTNMSRWSVARSCALWPWTAAS